MPYRVRKRNKLYQIQKEVKKGSWRTIGKSKTKAKAQASVRLRESFKKH